MPRLEREALVDDDRGQTRIEHGRAERVLEAADQTGSYTNASCGRRRRRHSVASAAQRFCRRAGDDQDLEVGPPRRCLTAERGRQHVRRHRFVVLIPVPIPGVLTEGPVEQVARDAPGQLRGCGRVVRRHMLPQRTQEPQPRIGVEFLRCRHLGERCRDLGAVGLRAASPAFGQFRQIAPLVGPCSSSGEKSIDPDRATIGCLGHLALLWRGYESFPLDWLAAGVPDPDQTHSASGAGFEWYKCNARRSPPARAPMIWTTTSGTDPSMSARILVGRIQRASSTPHR